MYPRIVSRLAAIPTAVSATFALHGARVVHVPAVRFAILAAIVAAVSLLFPLPAVAQGGLLAIAAGDIASNVAQEVIDTFKRVYLEASDAVPDSTPLTAQLNRTRKVKGAPDALYFNVKVETGGAVANVRDSGVLPRPSRPKRKNGKSQLCHTYTTIAVGGQSIPLTKDNRNAFVSNLEEQLEDGMTRVQNDIERQYNGDGRGILCVISAIGAAPTYSVTSPYGTSGYGPGTMLLIEDMDVATINPAGGAERDRGKISSIDADLDTFTADAALAGTQIGDYVVLCNDNTATGSDRETNYLNEAAGILAVTQDDDTFENIDATTARRWRAVVMAVNGYMTEKVASTLDARVQTKSGKRPSLYYTTAGIRLSLQESLAARRQSDGETLELKGGYEGLKINNRAVLDGPWCPKGNWFALNTDKKVVGMVDVVKMGYVDLDGSKLHRIEGRHAYRADLWFPHQAIWHQRNCHGRASGLTDDNTIVR